MDDPNHIDQDRDEVIPAAPLYDVRFEHDACGVGFVAESRLGPSDRVVPLALAALGAMAHRGATGADSRTSDGSGLTLPLTDAQLERACARLSGLPGRRGRLALGMVFLPQAAAARGRAVALVERSLEAERLAVVGWRPVPIEPAVLGAQAAGSLPCIRQVVVAAPATLAPLAFERKLFFARHAIERQAVRLTDLEALHVVSLSSRTTVYKALVRGADLATFYPDLACAPAVDQATFHQRFSTNTRPTWRLAQPFRYLAHNGEINTLRSNRQAMAGRSARLGGGRFGTRLARLEAAGARILDPAGSDSLSLDEALEVLVLAGWTVPAALAALVPEALALRDRPIEGLADWQAGMALRCEPWDGPAALVFSDGRQVGALLDRNGLRPAAWELRRDGLVVLASEAGLLAGEPGEVIRRGRLGPGEMFVVEPGAGRVLDDGQAKAELIASIAAAAPPRPLAALLPAARPSPV
ncbi:MAG: glutamate synthase subunit alpha, partial [Candidatus Limnocylindrales bacterium]